MGVVCKDGFHNKIFTKCLGGLKTSGDIAKMLNAKAGVSRLGALKTRLACGHPG